MSIRIQTFFDIAWVKTILFALLQYLVVNLKESKLDSMQPIFLLGFYAGQQLCQLVLEQALFDSSKGVFECLQW